MPILLATRSFSPHAETKDCYSMLSSHVGLYNGSGNAYHNSLKSGLE